MDPQSGDGLKGIYFGGMGVVEDEGGCCHCPAPKSVALIAHWARSRCSGATFLFTAVSALPTKGFVDAFKFSGRAFLVAFAGTPCPEQRASLRFSILAQAVHIDGSVCAVVQQLCHACVRCITHVHVLLCACGSAWVMG